MTHSANNYEAVILDLDGVITHTAEVHGRAWKQMFDEFLADRAPQGSENSAPFDIDSDYSEFVDGKPRYDGVRSFLSSRGIELPEGSPDDSPHARTVFGLGRRKNELFHELLESEGVETYPDAVEQIRRWRNEGLRLAVVSSSRNCRQVLNATNLTTFFDAIVDGNDLDEQRLDGKPAPDLFVEAARRLKTSADRSVVIEDAAAGVAAGRAGDFGLIIGIDRDRHGEGLLEHGADVVVHDLRDLHL